MKIKLVALAERNEASTVLIKNRFNVFYLLLYHVFIFVAYL